jgi:hypothetical protein
MSFVCTGKILRERSGHRNVCASVPIMPFQASFRSHPRPRGCSAPRTAARAPRPQRTAPGDPVPESAAVPGPPAVSSGPIGPAGIGRKRGGAVGIDADMVEHRRGLVRGIVAPGVGDDLLRESRAPGPLRRRRPSCRPRARPAVGQKSCQRAAIAAQHRGRDVGQRVGDQARDQVFDEPGGVSGASPCRFTMTS